MQVISSSPPSPAVASFRVSTRGGQVVSGCKGTSGQVCAPPGGCSPGFYCRIGWVFSWMFSCFWNDKKFAKNLFTKCLSLLPINLTFSFSGAGKTQVECASKENEGELTTFIPLSSLIIFRAVLTFWKWKVKLIYYSTYFWGQLSTWILFWPFSPPDSWWADSLTKGSI